MTKKLFYLPYFILIPTLLLITACGSLTPENNTSTLLEGAFNKVYQFSGDPDSSSRLSLSIQHDNITYSAQLSNFAGVVITTINNTTLQTMEFIIPIGETQYYVNIATEQEAWLNNIDLTIEPINKPTQSDASKFMNIAYSAPAVAVCEIWVTPETTAYLFAQPTLTAQALLALPINIPFQTDARTIDGWYRLTIEGTTGWVNGNQVQLNGACANLPVDTTMQPTSTTDATTTAPYDADRHYFAIHADQGGVFTNKVSYPTGDSTDTIQTSLSNFQADRTIGVVMTCTGTGVESLQWGQSQNVTLGCGDTLALSFTQQVPDIQLTVLLPAVNGQQYVDYQLEALPIAPADDDQHVVVVDRNQGGALRQIISYPAGDTQDTLAIYAHNLQLNSPNNYREFTLFMRCQGSQVESLRWGIDNTVLGCGDRLVLSLSQAETVRYLNVHIPPFEGHSFIDYTLYALPSASVDDTFWFGVDRNDGGTFNETLSSPLGDTADSIEVIMSNLTRTAPNHYREMTMTLYCEGFNQGNIRWGLPNNPRLYCGETVTTTFTYSANQQTIDIISIDATVQSYVNYTLVVAPKPSAPLLQNPTG